MAQIQRDNAPTFSTEDQSKSTRPSYRPTAAPLFVSRGQREPITFANHNASRRRRQAVQQDIREEREQALSAGSSPTDELPPALTAANLVNNNWLEGRNGSNERRFGLSEAWQMADENLGYRPKTSEGLQRSTETGSPLRESRIPRSKTFSPGQRMELGPPSTLTEAYRMAEREDLNARGRIASSESDTTGSRQGSPSPAAKARRDAKYRSQGLAQYSDEDVEKMRGWRQRAQTSRQGAQRKKENRSPVIEDPSDEFAKTRAKNAARDARISRLAQSTTPLFVKVHNPSQVPTRVVETARELEKKTSDLYADEPEPPLNIPRQWGSKARQRPGWVQRILHPESPVDIDTPPTGSDDLLRLAADTPLPSVEVISEQTPPSSRPASAQPLNASPEKSKLWDADVDFTAHSIQISTSPQLRVRKLDQLREQEIQSLTARAVATNRLEEIRERNSEERSVLSETPRSNFRKPTPEPTKRQQSEEPYYERTILDDEGEHIRGTPVTIFSAKTYRGSSSSREGEAPESGHKREDSFEALRKLSRTASRSPAPPGRVDEMEAEHVRSQEESFSKKQPEAIIESAEKTQNRASEQAPPKAVERVAKESDGMGLDVQSDSKRNSRSSSRPRSEIDPEERIAAEAKLFDLPDSKSERNSIRAPSPPPSSDEDELLDETPRPKKIDPLSLPTPRVMGAFIETPAPTVRTTRALRTISPYYEAGENDTASSSVPESSSSKDDTERTERPARRRRSSSPSTQQEAIRPQQRIPRPRPPLINSAKPTSASEDLRRIKLEAQIEDSTLEDFDGLLNAIGKPSESGDRSEILKPLLDLEYDERGNPLSKKERERRLEAVILDRMNQHLKNTSSSIRDARQGIERLEHQVSSSIGIPIAHKNEDNTVYIKIPVPRLWIKDPLMASRERRGWLQRNWKFTWLGLILFIFSTWFITESIVCDVYCHPYNSKYNTWQPTDPFFPWAIPTKLDQWTGEYASTAAYDAWQYIDGLMGPKIGRRRWFSRPRPMGASDWWLGRDGPVGIKSAGNEGSSIFGDEII